MSRQAQAERERQARIILGQAETEISDKFAQAAWSISKIPSALHLRAMNMLYEAIKEKGLDGHRALVGRGNHGTRRPPGHGGPQQKRSKSRDLFRQETEENKYELTKRIRRENSNDANPPRSCASIIALFAVDHGALAQNLQAGICVDLPHRQQRQPRCPMPTKKMRSSSQ